MKYSPVIDLAWQMAAVEASTAKLQFIEPEHFLAGITKLKQLSTEEATYAAKAQGADISMWRPEMEMVADVLAETGIDPDDFRHQLRGRLGNGTYEFGSGETIHRSDRSRKMFEQAEAIAVQMGAMWVSTGHLFLAILEDKNSLGCRMLIEKKIDVELLVNGTRQHLVLLREKDIAGGRRTEDRVEEKSSTPFLDKFGRDLTKLAGENKLGPVIGRRKEILQVIQTLARRSKNNPVLVGEAGVGKTAIAEAVAIRAASGKDRRILNGKRIVELNMSAVVGGTIYRGEFEQRLTRLIEECRTHPEVILFIDELHTVVGAGRGEGSMDAANILKPALARGDVRCIGATTITEYRRFIESDAALERRFEKITVPEPSSEETLEILRGILPKLEEHHGVKIDDKALEAAIELSIRFDCDHQLPDKAIDLVDKAGARVQVPGLSTFSVGDQQSKCSAGEPECSEHVGTITGLTIAEVLSEKVGVPREVITGHMEGMAESWLLKMTDVLKERIIGQDEAIERVSQRLQLAHTGLTKRRGPLAVFLFLGPTGVGKTELARVLASFLFGSEDDMIRLDMSEYSEQHSVARLIGSPPGYVGHEEEGQLTGKLRTRPYSVVLMDEIEKAHPRVFDLFLQVFDEGRLTDSKGRTADARHAIFIMTSNITAERQVGFRHQDTTDLKIAALGNLGGWFRKEFLNRVNEQIVFRPLDSTNVEKILSRMLDEISQGFSAKYGKSLEFSNGALELIASKGFNDEFGVRHLRRTVQTLVEAPLSHLVLSGEIKNWPAVAVTVQNEQVVLQPKLNNVLQ